MNAQTLSVTSVHHLHCKTGLKEFSSGCLLLLFFSISAFADTHYVSLSGSHTTPFTDWATAARDIQAAIDVAEVGDMVLVSNGIYATGGRVVYGARSNRVAITKPVTVRSVNGPAMTIIQGAGPMGDDSAVRCAYVGIDAVLEGFTLTNGATRFGPDDERYWCGGGVWCESSSVLSNCVLTGNSAFQGGGAYGGTLYNCALTGNWGTWHGGGAYGGTLYNCTLTGNSADSGGGASHGTLYNCTLTGNSAGLGAGAVNGMLYNCTLTGNSAHDAGGAALSTLYNCTLTSNSAFEDGGGVINGTLYNCTLMGNSAHDGGGSCWGATLYNCTLASNSASNGGGAYYGTLYNCIVYYNTAPNGSNYLSSTLTYSCTTPDAGGIGNITNDPRFVNAAAGDYHLQSTSPCLNVGTNQDWMIGATDLDGHPRLDVSGLVDMGAYEYQGMSIWSNTTAPTLVDGGPDSPVELGVKFRSDVDGTIAGIRFYKAAANTGAHIGNLWTSNGTLLATAIFINETASGWQQALFATPVAIASNTVYVASYQANNGHYSEDDYYFQGKGVDNPPLHALANGVAGGNGVYRYGASSLFPNQTWHAANYYVDLVFQAKPVPILTSIVVMPTNSNIVIGATQQFTATGTYSDGSARDITSQATWTSSDTGVATINTRGLATGVSDGIPIISASLAGVTGSTLLTVQPPPSPIHYVSLSGAHVPPFTNWSTAATNIQAAIDVAVDGDTIWVTNGVYDTGGRVVYGELTNRIAITKPVTVRSVNGPAMTIIQGARWRGDNGAGRCVYVGSNAVLVGFTLTNGATCYSGDSDREQSGGGVWCESSGVVSNCVLNGNWATYGGGAAFGTLYNCTLTGNWGTWHGGGGAYYSTLYNCTLTGNWSDFGGGACYSTLYNCTLTGNSAGLGAGAGGGTLYNCTLTGNSAHDAGGACYSTLYNCTLTSNSASSYGGGAFYGTLYNCTLTGNSASNGGGAFYGTLYNCIVYYNTALSDSNWLGSTLNYSCTTPDPGGVGNITNDPRFVNAAAGDYHLQATSPCINSGTNQDWMIGATDLDGNPRLDASGRVDMGAYEYQGPIVSAVTIWLSNAVPGRVDGGPDSAVELGVKFRSDVAGIIAGIRFYKADANTGSHTGNLWSITGTRLATVTFSNETVSGWQQALFATPVTITSNTVYVASYHANNGHYSADVNYFQGKGVDNPPLHALANGVSGGNGVYRYGAGSLFPNQTWNAANYYVDVVFQPKPAPILMSIAVTSANSNIVIGATQQFTATGTYSDGSTRNVTSQTTWTSSSPGVATINAAGLATGVSIGTTTISATLAGVVGATTLTVQAAPLVITTTSLSNGVSNTVYMATLAASGGVVPYTWSILSGTLPAGLTLNSGTGVISGTPTATGTFNFTVQVSDTGGHTATRTLSITITSIMPTVITIWPSTTVPGRVDEGPDSAVELGVKFKSDVAGIITGIRFYKADANTGSHTGNLWSITGTRLATVTFSNETVSGWQQALFATPVTITSNTVYVASYHANNGHYSCDLNYFTGKGMDNPPLHALANGVSGGNGVYRYGASSLFPNQTWNAANYWVDVIFQPASPPPSLTSLTLMTAGENVDRWPWVWTSGDLSGEWGASNLIDGNTNTLWIGNVGGEPWRVILDLGVVTDVTGIQLMFQDIAWTNKELIGSRDSEVWFDYLAETNEWALLRYLYINFRGDEHGNQPPVIREIIWRNR